MFKIIILLNKKNGMTDEAFKERYEHGHVPLILKIIPNIQTYKRNYVRLENGRLLTGGGPLSFDVISEMFFADRGSFDTALRALDNPATAEALAADEAELFDRATIRIFPVEECACAGLS